MAKLKPKTVADRYKPIEKSLQKLKKQELIELLMQLGMLSDSACKELESRLKIDKPAELIVHDINSAIMLATEVDDSSINYNFDYDDQAYSEIESGFKSLIKLGELDSVKTLAVELMSTGSYQVECSDEGLMSDEIEDCLLPVIKAVKQQDSDGGRAWAKKMIAADRVGFICDNSLKKMAS